MAAHVIIEFPVPHAWPWATKYNLYHGQGSQVDYSVPLEPQALPLWRRAGQKAGFGFGRFGSGSFGWAQGYWPAGGFGEGYFGYGEFGYFNSWQSRRTRGKFADGLHSFAVLLFDACGNVRSAAGEAAILIVSTPRAPGNLKLKSFAGGSATVGWVGSTDV